MAGRITFAMLKPDAVKNGHIGKIIDRIIQAGFQIRAMKMVRLTDKQAAQFYIIHKDRPFYSSLIQFMTSGPCIPMILERENAVAEFRKLIGATDPAKAEEGTIRKAFATSIEANAIHGADSEENALREARFFFAEMEEI
jgi:nucleoside-diphosphate kinase